MRSTNGTRTYYIHIPKISNVMTRECARFARSMTLFILIKKNIIFFQIFKFLFLMIAYLLLYLHAKFEDQEAMGSRQACELKLLTKKNYFN